MSTHRKSVVRHGMLYPKLIFKLHIRSLRNRKSTPMCRAINGNSNLFSEFRLNP